MSGNQPTVARVPREGNLAWLDLEMTGLDPTRDVIVQAALPQLSVALPDTVTSTIL